MSPFLYKFLTTLFPVLLLEVIFYFIAIVRLKQKKFNNIHKIVFIFLILILERFITQIHSELHFSINCHLESVSTIIKNISLCIRQNDKTIMQFVNSIVSIVSILLFTKVNTKSSIADIIILQINRILLILAISGNQIYSKFIFIELISFISILIIWRSKTHTRIIGINYGISHMLGSIFILISIFSFYYISNHTNTIDINIYQNIFIIGMLILLGVAPLTFISINAYSNTFGILSILLIALNAKIISFVLIETVQYSQIIDYCSIFMMFYSVIYSVLQRNIKKSLLYILTCQLFGSILLSNYNTTLYISILSSEIISASILAIAFFLMEDADKSDYPNWRLKNIKTFSLQIRVILTGLIIFQMPSIFNPSFFHEHTAIKNLPNVHRIIFDIKNVAIMFLLFRMILFIIPTNFHKHIIHNIKSLNIQKMKSYINTYIFFIIVIFLYFIAYRSFKTEIQYKIILINLLSVVVIGTLTFVFSNIFLKVHERKIYDLHALYTRIIHPVVKNLTITVKFINYSLIEYIINIKKKIKKHVINSEMIQKQQHQNIVTEIVFNFFIILLMMFLTQL